MANIVAANIIGSTLPILGLPAVEQVFGTMNIHQLVRVDYQNTVLGDKGLVVQIPVMGSITDPVQRSANSQFTLDAPSDSSINITINDPWTKKFKYEDTTQTISGVPYMQYHTAAAVKALVKRINIDLLTLFQTATYKIGTGGNALSASTILLAQQTLFDNLTPEDMPQYTIISSKDNTALMNDSKFFAAYSYGEALVPEGKLGKMYGFTNFKTQYVTVSAGTTYNAAFARDAIALVCRPLPVTNSMGVEQMVVFQDGIYIRFTKSYDPNYNADAISVEVFYGYGVVRQIYMVAMQA